MSASSWRLLLEQMELGPRFVGSEGHARMHRWLDEKLSGTARGDHCFEASFFGKAAVCHNFVARFPGRRPGRLMLGTHYDTRPYADCDPDPARRREPVPGANDGASGTALLLALRPWLEATEDRPSVELAFFDAEDWHEIDGKQVSLGSRRFVESLADSQLPDALVVFDMIAARGLRVQLDLSVQDHAPSLELSVEIHRLARSLGLDCFEGGPSPTWVQDDHSPFLARGVPSCLLIDMDYAHWHTVQDRACACEPAVLDEIEMLAKASIVTIALTPRNR